MAKKFSDLFNKMSPKAQASVLKKSEKILNEMHLRELRHTQQLSQEHVAEVLATKQANISRLEHRADMHISTLRSYIEAMGGKLDIIARFSNGEVHINL